MARFGFRQGGDQRVGLLTQGIGGGGVVQKKSARSEQAPGKSAREADLMFRWFKGVNRNGLRR